MDKTKITWVRMPKGPNTHPDDWGHCAVVGDEVIARIEYHRYTGWDKVEFFFMAEGPTYRKSIKAAKAEVENRWQQFKATFLSKT